MLRILHLTDFHLNKKTLQDWESYIYDSLSTKLQEINSEKEIDLIVFSGDLIDKSGKELGSAKQAFEKFKEKIILPICSSLNISNTRCAV